MSKKYTIDDFITKSIECHGAIYDYSESIFIGMTQDIKIICSTHGPFYKRAGIHTGQRGKKSGACPYCHGKIEMTGQTTQEFLRKWYVYDKDTGQFMNKATLKEIGASDGRYRIASINGKMEPIHRIIFLYMVGRIPEVVDHRNQNKVDNSWNNLRASNISLNTLNNPYQNIHMTDALTYKVKFMYQGKNHQKTFKTIEQAEIYRDKLAQRIEYKSELFHQTWLVQDIV